MNKTYGTYQARNAVKAAQVTNHIKAQKKLGVPHEEAKAIGDGTANPHDLRAHVEIHVRGKAGQWNLSPHSSQLLPRARTKQLKAERVRRGRRPCGPCAAA